uniref:Uncharacterized protein n=1 Tax=uncultured bacterium A1Q1_fos_1050 TaxID=1256538 RepID=L7VU46_9BACT|nr:hypothetical protein [uncultured bacterium A1Q1_fos_1050]
MWWVRILQTGDDKPARAADDLVLGGHGKAAKSRYAIKWSGQHGIRMLSTFLIWIQQAHGALARA